MIPFVLRAASSTLAAALVAAAARRQRALTRLGGIAAAVVGGAVVAGAGWRTGASLVVFFASSTLLGRLPGARVALEQRRGNERDAIQVAANGGVATMLAVASSAVPPRWQSLMRTGAGGAIAAAAADTWATELGSRSSQRPRSLATLRPVRPGASGGVTVLGLAASLAGATVSALPLMSGDRRIASSLPIVLGGMVGSLVDSLLGATWQEVRVCDICGTETEQRLHCCGRRTRRLRGRVWCDNDTVNALATAAGALTAMALASRPTLTAFDRARPRNGRVRSPRDASPDRAGVTIGD